MRWISFVLVVLCLPAVADAGPIRRAAGFGKSAAGRGVEAVRRVKSCFGGACR